MVKDARSEIAEGSRLSSYWQKACDSERQDTRLLQGYNEAVMLPRIALHALSLFLLSSSPVLGAQAARSSIHVCQLPSSDS